MAHRGLQLDSVSCSICLETLKDPGTTPCGHSFCIKCLQHHWDQQNLRYSCPQCRQSFSPRPVLVKNTVLADLVEQLKETGLTAPPADRCYAGPQDVSCDVCSDRKLKAVQSCLQCVASYCERHLQPHYDSAALQRHQLIAPSHTLLENTCSEHNQVKTMFCRTDGQLLCVVCCLDQHKDHETVSSASERAQRQARLEAQRDLLLRDVQHKDTELSSLQQQEQDIRTSAHTALQLSRDSFRDMILLLETRAKEVEQQIQSEEKRGLSRVREIQDQVKQELRELKKSLCDLDTLSLTKDHNSFLQLHTALASHSQRPVPVRGHSEGPVPARGHTETRSPFEEVTRAVSELRERLQLTVDNISLALSPVQLLTTEPKTREEFLQYSTHFTLDTNTVNTCLSLSDGNRRVTFMRKQKYPDHQDRFSLCQVLSRESVRGRCYWEVEWSSEYYVRIAVSYRDIQRKGSNECLFGNNDKSWALICHKTSPSFMFNSVQSKFSGRVGSRVGVFLDHSKGVLSFYNVSENMRLIHREQTTFSQPLHAGDLLLSWRHCKLLPLLRILPDSIQINVFVYSPKSQQQSSRRTVQSC